MTTADLLLKKLKGIASYRLDTSKKNDPKMWVSARDILDLCTHAELAMEGEYKNADYSIQVLLDDKHKLLEQMDKISELHDPDSETWKLAMDHGVF